MTVPNTDNTADSFSTQPTAPRTFASDKIFSLTPAEPVERPVSTAGQESIPQAPPAAVIQGTPLNVDTAITQNNVVEGLARETTPADTTVQPALEPTNPFSFDLPDEASVSVEAPAPPSNSAAPLEVAPVDVLIDQLAALPQDAPEWQREALTRLETDTDIDPEDKKLIAKTNPSGWDRARRWNKNSKILSNLTRDDYPVEEKVNHLRKQLAPQTFQTLNNRLIADTVSTPESLSSFAATNPEVYRDLMVGLVTTQPDAVKTILESQGYRVERSFESAPMEVESLLKQLQDANPDDYDLIANTPVEEQLKAILGDAATRDARLRELEADRANQSAAKGEAAPAADDPQIAERQSLYSDVIKSWESDFDKALKDSGITPPTPEDFRQNYQAAVLRDTAYTIAKSGYGDKSPNWFNQLMDWGTKRTGFNEAQEQIVSSIEQGRKEDALSYGRSASADVYELGKLRAKMPAVKAYLDMANNLSGKLPTTGTIPAAASGNPLGATQVNSGVQPVAQALDVNGQPIAQQQKRVFLSDRLQGLTQ